MSEFSKIEIKKIRTSQEWELWDNFIYKLKFASFLSYSFWLNSYLIIPKLVRKVGFSLYFHGDIVGGISGIQLGFWPFQITIFPSGPFFLESVSENHRVSFLDSVLSNASIKYSKIIQFASRKKIQIDQDFRNGKKVRGIYLDVGTGLIRVEENEKSQLDSFKLKVKRDIKVSLNRNLTLKIVEEPEELYIVYNQFKKNALDNGYKIRPFWMYKKIWKKSLESKKSIFFLVYLNDQVKGAAWFIEAGEMFNYIMGGSSKEKPSLYVGYFIHWHIMKLSIERGYSCYNISIGGTKGVEAFKDDFGRAIVNSPSYQYKGI